MYIVHVDIHVKPESVEEFRRAALDNAYNSLQEPGIARFDFIQDMGDPAHFMLVEVYRSPEAANQHKETAHYLRWRDAVVDLMAVPRASTKFTNLFPEDSGW